MMIRVKYLGGATGMVRPPLLKRLIHTGKIIELRRSEGWVIVGQDSVKENKCVDYL